MSSSSRVKFTSDEVIDRFLGSVDVWHVIFEMLSVKDLIRLEMTNKRLRMFMFAFWKRVKSFDTECLREISKNLWAAFVAICVDRIGDCLRSLTIREKFFPIASGLSPVWSANLGSIGEGCPNIERINFVFDAKHGTLDIHFDSFSRLKTLIVNIPGEDYFVYASASIFLSIPPSIEVIHGLGGMNEEPFENAAQLEGFFTDRPSLREVCLCCPLYTRDKSKADVFRVIAQRCPNLKSISLHYYNAIDYRGVVALEEMKELLIPHLYISWDEMEVVTICERSPLVVALALAFGVSPNLHLQSAALNAIGSLTKLDWLWLFTDSVDVLAPSLVTEFVRNLARNSGASLRDLHLESLSKTPLPTAAIEALANGCPKLRYVHFHVSVGGATPASIRFLIDSIVAHPSWIRQTGGRTLVIEIGVICDGGDEAEAGLAAFQALAAPAANLPARVKLSISICN